jgi:hypothetical protein
VTWEDDWPVFNRSQPLKLEMEGPAYKYEVPKAWRDDFKSSEMQLGWYRKSMSMH